MKVLVDSQQEKYSDYKLKGLCLQSNNCGTEPEDGVIGIT